MMSINTIQTNELGSIFANKKRIVSGFLNVSRVTPQAYTLNASDHNIFLEMKFRSRVSDAPNVFSLNMQNSNQLMNSVSHIQPSKTPFDLNFSIPPLDSIDLSEIYHDSKVIVNDTPVTQEETAQKCNLSYHNIKTSRARYWESETILTEITPIRKIHIPRTITQELYVNYVQQMLLGFQNTFFYYFDGEYRIQEQFVEDMTALQDIHRYFATLGTNVQRLRLQICPTSRLKQKINTILSHFVDEFHHEILALMIDKPDITILSFYMSTKTINAQIRQLTEFLDHDPYELLQILYQRLMIKSSFLQRPFIELNNFLLSEFQKAINEQLDTLAIPKFYPDAFHSAYPLLVAAMRLISFDTQIMQICQFRDFSLAGKRWLKQYYRSQEIKLQNMKIALDYKKKSAAKALQLKRKQEFARVQQKLHRQRELEANNKKNQRRIRKENDQQLVIQIEMNRINRKYDKLFREQEERDQLLEIELKEKRILYDEKQKLLSQLQTLNVPFSDQQSIISDRLSHIEEEVVIRQGPTKRLQTEIEVETPIIHTPLFDFDELPEPEYIIEEMVEEFVNDDSMELRSQIDISIGLHSSLHLKLVNQALHFILFDQLDYLHIWEQIRNMYLTRIGDMVESDVFPLVDSLQFITPAKLATIEHNPRLVVKSQLAYQKQYLYQLKLQDSVSLEFHPKQEILLQCFPQQIINKIIIIFDALIKLRYSAYQLRMKWKTQSSIIRHQMQQFIDLYLNYIFYDVIESTWVDFIKELTKADYDKLITVADSYLNKILEISLIKTERKSINDSLQKSLLLINQFTTYEQPSKELIKNFRQQSSFFKKSIQWLKEIHN